WSRDCSALGDCVAGCGDCRLPRDCCSSLASCDHRPGAVSGCGWLVCCGGDGEPVAVGWVADADVGCGVESACGVGDSGACCSADFCCAAGSGGSRGLVCGWRGDSHGD